MAKNRAAVKLLITGRPGVGKTTLVKRVLETLGSHAMGFYTQEIREAGQRQGFRIVTTWNEEGILAHKKLHSVHRVSRYGVNLCFLERVVAGIKKRLDEGAILVIDEIGRMELFSSKFRNWIEEVAPDPGIPFMATIAFKARDPLVVKLKRTLPPWQVTLENRDNLPQRVIALFSSKA